MSEAARIMARAEEALRRHGGNTQLQKRAFQRAARGGIIRAKRLAWLTAAFLFGVPLFALFVAPLGIGGIILAAMLYFGLVLAAVLIPSGARADGDLPTVTSALAKLPLNTEAWLASQRPMLPPVAQRLADGIGVKLEQLAPQLDRLDERDPAAFEIRRLIGDELPELVKGYERVPPHLRREASIGTAPEVQLVEGLRVVDSELDRICRQLADGDLKALATQGRYLELKYQDDPA